MASTVTDPDAVALQLQDITYAHWSLITIMVHDWLILLDREIEHIWRRKWSIGKILFIISRYGAFLDIPITLVIHTAPYGAIDYDTCNTIYKISAWSTTFGISISESILLLRTHAIYSGSKRVTIPLTIIYTVLVLAGILITWRYLRTTLFGQPPSPLFEGCYLVRGDVIIFFAFLMLLAFELVVVILTVRKGFRDFYSGTPLMRVVYRDSVAFFLVLFAVTVSTILVLALAPSEYGGLGNTATRVFHSIVCCRILLNLKGAATPENTAVTASAGLAFVTSPRGQTEQTETIQLETYGTRDGEGNYGGGIVGTPSRDMSRTVGEVE